MTDRSNPNPDDRNIEISVARCYSTWGETYYRDYYGVDAPYPPVHRDLIVSLVELPRRQARRRRRVRPGLDLAASSGEGPRSLWI